MVNKYKVKLYAKCVFNLIQNHTIPEARRVYDLQFL